MSAHLRARIAEGVDRIQQGGGQHGTELCRLMTHHKSDKGNGWHNYTLLYDALFDPLRDQPVQVFEMGLGTNDTSIPSNMGKDGHFGASVFAWAEYFRHPDTRIFGADIDARQRLSTDRIQSFYADQTDPTSIQALWDTAALRDVSWDIFVDDGLHEFEANRTLFEHSFHKLKPGGIYIIEDILRPQLGLFEAQRSVWAQRPDVACVEVLDLPNPQNRIDNILMILVKQEPVTDALYVTAFKDIGRGSWEMHEVPTERYISQFLPLAAACPRLVCYVERDLLERLRDLVPSTTCTLLPYPSDAESFFRYREREQSIMQGPAYQKALQHRLDHPEHCKPDYNLVNHNKVHLLRHAAETFPTHAFYAWIDFHYARHGDFPLPASFPKLPHDRATVASFVPPEDLEAEVPKSALQLAVESKDVFQGSAYVVPRGRVGLLYKEYDRQLTWNYHDGVADDDQNVHLGIYFRRPDLYHVVFQPRWGRLFSWVRLQ